ncbi:exonuclease domain-containing protein [Verrucomicrobium spinosum]|uniref:3'-5' exonuclease n=1 Tax=Verrucomicrobium spinosum TaxID=2736 RepID=UPI0012F624CE
MPVEPRILVGDIETTGLDERRHSILKIGLTWMTGGVGQFSIQCRMWEGAEWDARAAEVHGISFKEANDPALPTEHDAVSNAFDWIGQEKFIFAGLNPHMDRRFLNYARIRPGFQRGVLPDIGHRMIDLHSLAVPFALASGAAVPPRGFNTDEIYSLLGMPPEPRPHDAITGALMEAEAFRILFGWPTLSEVQP